MITRVDLLRDRPDTLDPDTGTLALMRLSPALRLRTLAQLAGRALEANHATRLE